MSTDNLRASDHDRDRTAEIVRQAATEGRLDLEEMEQRLDQVFAAKTYGELVRITEDLPNAQTNASPASTTQPQAALPTQGPTELSAIFGSETQSGEWLVPPALRVRAICGEVKLDVTEATIPHQVSLEVLVMMGQLTLYVPDDVAVVFEESGSNVMASRTNKTRAKPVPGTPVIRVRGQVMLGELVARPPKRRFGLRRR